MRAIPLLIASFFSIALPTAAGAALPVNTLQVFVSPSASGGTGPYEKTIVQSGTLDDSGSATGGFSSSGSATAHVEWGVIKLSGESAGTLNASARGIFRDDLVFTAPGIATGTFGMLTYAVKVDGNLLADSLNLQSSSWRLQADLGGGAFDINRSAQLFNGNLTFGAPEYRGDAFGTYSAAVSFQFGIAAPLDVELFGLAQSAYNISGSSPGHASFDLGHSLYWGGISNVSVGGQPISNYSIASASGTDYSRSFAPSPVPEPGSAALLSWGLAWLVRQRLRAKGGPATSA